MKRKKRLTEQELKKATNMRNIKKNVSEKIVRGTLKCKAAKKAEECAKKKRKKSGEIEEE